jgi:arginine decarboxylase
VLHYVEFDVERLVNKFRADIEAAVREGRVNDGEMGAMLRFYEDGLQGYTYLEEPPH